ncbi:AlpA family transcriptional regulator [Ralstonia pickettii]|jgi:predicted DNA-binding transcriptional regulator AlpA|uniref:helix-turn-helix transcriptional regulator n=1 Tax=Ralstonia pickettii TaxID=329 RepID=UPI002175E9AF|nr:AlpA family transcriptional regulator [Ralstonia pickettii]
MSNQQASAVSGQSSSFYRGGGNDANSMSRQLDKALRILRMKQVVERTGLSRATVYVLMATDPTFPRKIHLTARSVGFLEFDVDAWIASRAQLCASV